MNLTVFTHYYYHYSKKKTKKKKKKSKLVEEKFKENYCNSFVLQTTHPPSLKKIR